MTKMKLHVPRHLRNRHLLMLDALLLGLCTMAAYVVRFEGFHWGAETLYTALVYEGPFLVRRILRELPALLALDGFVRVEQAIGSDVERLSMLDPDPAAA